MTGLPFTYFSSSLPSEKTKSTATPEFFQVDLPLFLHKVPYVKMSPLCVLWLKSLQGCTGLLRTVWLNATGVMLQTIFWKSSKPIYLFFLSIYCFHLGTLSQQACRQRPDLETTWCWLFLQAGVAVETEASWKLGPTTHGIYCWCSVSLVNWECEGRNKGDRYSLSIFS